MMIDNVKSLLLELTKLDVSSLLRLETGDQGITVHSPAWTCHLGYPFPAGHLHIILA
jgi:hypothetical protein